MPGDLFGSMSLTDWVISARVMSPSHVLQSLGFKVGVFILKTTLWAASSIGSAVYNFW